MVAQGYNTAIIYGNGVLTVGTGTSFSTPIVSGALACLWQSVPDVSAEDIRSAIRENASHSNSPDNFVGWGIPDIMTTRNTLITLSANLDLAKDLTVFSLSPNPFSDATFLRASAMENNPFTVEVYSFGGKQLFAATFDSEFNTNIELSYFQHFPAGLYFIKVLFEGKYEVLRAIKY